MAEFVVHWRDEMKDTLVASARHAKGLAKSKEKKQIFS